GEGGRWGGGGGGGGGGGDAPGGGPPAGGRGFSEGNRGGPKAGVGREEEGRPRGRAPGKIFPPVMLKRASMSGGTRTIQSRITSRMFGACSASVSKTSSTNARRRSGVHGPSA